MFMILPLASTSDVSTTLELGKKTSRFLTSASGDGLRGVVE